MLSIGFDKAVMATGLLIVSKVLPFLFIDAQESEPWASGACSINNIHVVIVEDRPWVTTYTSHPHLASLCRWTF